MQNYRPDHFVEAYDNLDGEALWQWLHSEDIFVRLETASTLRRPAVEALSPLLKQAFPDKVQHLKFRQMAGHMVRQVMEARGYHLSRANVRISRKSSMYGYGSVYRIPAAA